MIHNPTGILGNECRRSEKEQKAQGQGHIWSKESSVNFPMLV